MRETPDRSDGRGFALKRYVRIHRPNVYAAQRSDLTAGQPQPESGAVPSGWRRGAWAPRGASGRGAARGPPGGPRGAARCRGPVAGGGTAPRREGGGFDFAKKMCVNRNERNDSACDGAMRCGEPRRWRGSGGGYGGLGDAVGGGGVAGERRGEGRLRVDAPEARVDGSGCLPPLPSTPSSKMEENVEANRKIDDHCGVLCFLF